MPIDPVQFDSDPQDCFSCSACGLGLKSKDQLCPRCGFAVWRQPLSDHQTALIQAVQTPGVEGATMSMVYCRACGARMHESALACPSCGAQVALVGPHRASQSSGGWFSFSGRIPRRVYWLHYQLPLSLVFIVADVLTIIANDRAAPIL